MKSIIFWLASFLSLSATPDWADKRNETFIGSNEKFYATYLTETNNQGSYYEWREIKKLNEYSKQDGSMINSTMVSDILYSIDANHRNPNTQPKITRAIQKQDKNVLLATLLTSYHLPLVPVQKPEWINRLSWKEGNIMLDDKLVIVRKNLLAGLDISEDIATRDPIDQTILQVHSDAESIYLVLKVDTETDYNTHVLHLSEEITKQLRDRTNMLEEYVFIKSFDVFEKANAYGLELIKQSQAKNFYGLNPEIWETNDGNKTEFLLLHRPLELPIDPEHMKRMDAATGINSSIIKSTDFVEKWIPFDPNAKPPIPDEEESIEEPEDLKVAPIEDENNQ